MDPVPTFPLPNEPPIDLSALIQSTNAAAHGFMPFVEGYYSTLEQRTAQAEAGLKKLAQPVTRSLSVRTSGATKRLATAVQPVVDALATGTAAAQRGMLDFPVPVATATSVFWAAVRCPDLAGQVIPAERGFPPDPGPGWRTYGPYVTPAEAQGAVAVYQRVLTADPACMQASGGGGGAAPPSLDWYWVD